MESLVFFIKEHKPFVLFYGLCLSLGVILLVYDVYRISIGYTDKTMIRFLLKSVLLPTVTILYCFYYKKFFKVYKDYKKQNKETKILYLNYQSYGNCLDEFNGAYKLFFCSDKSNRQKVCYWLYRKDLMYEELTNGVKYKVTYYKNSKCLYSIEPIFDDVNIIRNQKKITKSTKKSEESKQVKIPTKVCFWSFHNSLFKFFKVQRDGTKTITELVTTVGIPVEKHKVNFTTPEFVLRVQSENGQKKTLRLRSLELLGLGDLSKRPGYMGYGNFIGTRYEVEYFKNSYIVTSIKAINKGNQGTVRNH